MHYAGSEPIGVSQALLDLAQNQNAGVRRQQTTIKFRNNGLVAGR